MDGVLVDSEPLWRRAEVEIFAEVGLSLAEKDCLQTQGLRIDEAVAWWFERHPWSGRACDDVARAIVVRVAELIQREAVPLPGAAEALEIARATGWRLALASSSSKQLIETVLDHFGWADAFECTHSAEDETFGKPHPAVDLSAASPLDIAPSACIAIEDSVNGVLSALAAGMRCIAVPSSEAAGDPRFRIAHARLDSLAKLPEALENWQTEAST